MVTPHSGRRAATWEPSIQAPAVPEPQAVPQAEPETDREVTEADRAALTEWVAAHKAERHRDAIAHGMGRSR